jgi:hypothetical protein
MSRERANSIKEAAARVKGLNARGSRRKGSAKTAAEMDQGLEFEISLAHAEMESRVVHRSVEVAMGEGQVLRLSAEIEYCPLMVGEYTDIDLTVTGSVERWQDRLARLLLESNMPGLGRERRVKDLKFSC